MYMTDLEGDKLLFTDSYKSCIRKDNRKYTHIEVTSIMNTNRDYNKNNSTVVMCATSKAAMRDSILNEIFESARKRGVR